MSGRSVAFRPPPVDGTHTLDQMHDWHRVHSADAGAFLFDEGEEPNCRMSTLTWRELGEGIIRGAEMIEKTIPELREPSSEQEPMVFGILSTSDIVTYFTLLLSHMRLSHPAANRRPIVPFAISPRNSPAAVAHLITVTSAKYVWATEGPMMAILEEALSQEGVTGTTILPMPSFTDLFPPNAPPIAPRGVSDAAANLDMPGILLHSSGSTAFPKVQKISHRVLIEWSQGFDQGKLKAQGEIVSTHLQPVYHAMGVILATWAAVTGFVRCVGSPHLPFIPITPEYLLKQALKSKSKILVVVPNFLEAWSKDPKSIEMLKTINYIIWGGAMLHPDIGRFLYKEGVRFQTVYGATEYGIVTCFTDTPNPEGFEWFSFLPHLNPVLLPEAEGVYELAFKNSELHHPSAFNTEIDGIPGYASNDLVERHPTNPSLYRMVGRKDDQIMLSTGEKTNPGPMETIITKDKHVETAIVFGQGRFQNGVLIEPASYEESTRLGLEQFRNLIWPSVEAANNFAPAHSRIFKEMILVASPDKPFQRTFKGNVRRGVTLNEYDAEINTLYQLVEDSAQVDVAVPHGAPETGGWKFEEGQSFVRQVVKQILKGANDIRDDDDLFVLGCDSLQATYIRNSILHALRQTIPRSIVNTVPSNFMYQKTTIRSLARYAVAISGCETAAAVAALDTEQDGAERLHAMVAKYTQDWPVHHPSGDAYNPACETILLTGSTGGVGSQLLAQLIVASTASKIYALNRPGDGRKSLKERHVQTFVDRGNDVALLDSPKIIFVEADTSVEGFGIDPQLYGQIRDSVTSIIHNAWRVDFNISLASFEPAIRGVRLMVDLALKSPHPHPPRLLFTSSIGVVQASPEVPRVSEGPITDMKILNPSGYGESKWVSERILSAAGRETALRPIIVRVGQLCGGVNGNWNAREWFPSLVRASQVIGAVPERHELVSFLPLHVAASALIELRNSSKEFAHLVHPRPIPWMLVAEHVAKALGVSIIPYKEWLQRLEACPTTDDALQNNPALHLLPFFRAALLPQNDKNREAMGMVTCETVNAVADAPSLRPENLPQLGNEDVDSWIGYWRGKGVLTA